MPLRDKNQLRTLFEKKKAEIQSGRDRSGINAALSTLAQVTHNMQDAGMDVSIEMTGDGSKQAFSMFGNQTRSVPVSGILRIGEARYLLAFCDKVGDLGCLRMALSEYEITQQGGHMPVFASVYDIAKDNIQAWNSFESRIIGDCARHAALSEIDKTGIIAAAPHKPLFTALKKGRP